MLNTDHSSFLFNHHQMQQYFVKNQCRQWIFSKSWAIFITISTRLSSQPFFCKTRYSIAQSYPQQQVTFNHINEQKCCNFTSLFKSAHKNWFCCCFSGKEPKKGTKLPIIGNIELTSSNKSHKCSNNWKLTSLS